MSITHKQYFFEKIMTKKDFDEHLTIQVGRHLMSLQINGSVFL